jgi:3-oxoacyl-[acyl-carrier-protein] synthase II
LVSGKPGNKKIKIAGVKTVHKPKKSIEDIVAEFLSGCELTHDKIDFLLMGKSGDSKLDEEINKLSTTFNTTSTGVYKHLCGEYPVASSFALWLASSILNSNKIPARVLEKNRNRELKTILIYNRYFRDHHSLMLLSKF